MATEKNPFAYEEDESFIPPEPEEGVEVLSDGSVEVTIQEEEVEEEEGPHPISWRILQSILIRVS